MTAPRRVIVKEIVTSRYSKAVTRPARWEERKSGLEEINTSSGERLELYSFGGQSTPQPGWEILLTKIAEGQNQKVFQWTLFGIKK